MLPYYIKRLGKLGYKLSASKRNGYRDGCSYYFKDNKQLPIIRLSNHILHPSQGLSIDINIIINEDHYLINDKHVNVNGFVNIKKSSAEYLLLEIYLFKKGMSKT